MQYLAGKAGNERRVRALVHSVQTLVNLRDTQYRAELVAAQGGAAVDSSSTLRDPCFLL
ncbi:MAG TPA: hypothetical protein VNA24_20030 [Hyalangium sp.]|jgi:hypothetical protein|nr:hypothetical protein [Hyalangium sp.]